MAEVLVLADRGGVRRATRALLTLARRLGTPAAVTGGPPDPAGTAALGRFGAATIYAVSAPEVDEHPVAARVETLVHLARRRNPAAILIAAGRDGVEIAARVAVRLESGILGDVVDVAAGPAGPAVTQSARHGAYRVESGVVRGVPVLVVRTEHVTPAPAPVTPAVRAVEVPFPASVRAVRTAGRDRARPGELATAAVVVAGGRGVGSRDGFELVRRLAAALDGVPAGSHTAVERGWCPPESQVDQVGTVVHPSLYLALGISGSMRHRAAMHGAATVVAIGRDPQAPIFELADLGAVGDVHQIVPALLAEIERRRARPLTQEA